MRTAIAMILIAPFTLLPARASAQGAATASTATVWTGKAVALARVNGRSMAAACPTRQQIDHYVRERALKWDNASLGCRFMLSGNFSRARVVEEAGDYIKVTFTLTGFPVDDSYWTPRRNFRLQS